MIRMMAEGTLWGPCVICDNCNQRIADADSVAVIWPVTHGGAQMKVGYPQYAHTSQCRGAIEARLRDQGYGSDSDDLLTHLRKLQGELYAAKTTPGKPKESRQALPQA